MKLGIIASNLIERVAIRMNLVPTPLVDTHVAMMLARTVMVATRLGVFEVLACGTLTAEEVAAHCGTNSAATGKLLAALVGAGYLRTVGEQFSLTPRARKWLLKDSPHSIYPKLLFQFAEWEWIACYDEYIRSGQPINFHATMSMEQWEQYQSAMHALARLVAPEVARRTPVPPGATTMLDIGGSHGYFSVSLCRKYPALKSVILDLPEAVAQAERLMVTSGFDNRISYRAGDLLHDELGREAFDLIFMANVAHHFNEATNQALTRRVARALRPGGHFVIQEPIRPPSPGEGEQFASLLDLYYATISGSGTWAFDEIAGWQREAGLIPQKPIRLHLAPGLGQQVARKPIVS